MQVQVQMWKDPEVKTPALQGWVVGWIIKRPYYYGISTTGIIYMDLLDLLDACVDA